MDIIIYNIVIALGMLIMGYLIGSIPFSIILSKTLYHKDIREYGSKNAGGTNMGRVFGKKIGVITILLDMAKTILALVGAYLLVNLVFNPLFQEHFGQLLWDNGILYYYLAALGASFGHCWPIYAGFKGGKTVSVFTGFGVGCSWFEFLIGLICFFGLKIKTKYVSVASIGTAIGITITSWVMALLVLVLKDQPVYLQHLGMWGWGYYLLAGWEHASVITIIAIILVVRHIPNIKRLIKGEENKVGNTAK